MSELKVASCFEFEKVLSGKSNKLFYAKSEADKVIAEKDEELEKLKRQIDFLKVTHSSCKECNKCAVGMGKVFDERLKELKAENERLKATPEEIAKELYTKMLIYPHNMVRLEDAYRIAVSRRKTKRALWLARANMARGLAEMCEHQFDCCGVSRSRFLVGYDKKLKPKRMTTTEWGELWRKVEQKCRAKAEEYK